MGVQAGAGLLGASQTMGHLTPNTAVPPPIDSTVPPSPRVVLRWPTPLVMAGQALTTRYNPDLACPGTTSLTLRKPRETQGICCQTQMGLAGLGHGHHMGPPRCSHASGTTMK